MNRGRLFVYMGKRGGSGSSPYSYGEHTLTKSYPARPGHFFLFDHTRI